MIKVLLIFLVSLSGISEVAAYEKEIDSFSANIIKKIGSLGKSNITVTDFTNLQGDVTELGRFIAEELSVSLVSKGAPFNVIDRTHIKSIIKEHKLSETGIIDPQTARKLGKIAGVDALVTGTLTPFGDSVRLAVKILDTESAKIIDAQRSNIAKTKAIEELLDAEYVSSTQLRTVTKRSKKIIKSYQPSGKKIGNGLTVNLQKCVKTVVTVKCEFIIFSEKSNFQSYLYRTSRIFDDMGNENASVKAVFGDSVAARGNSYAGKILPKDIAIRSSLEFTGVSEDAQYLTLLEIHLNKSKVDFRDVAFTQ